MPLPTGNNLPPQADTPPTPQRCGLDVLIVHVLGNTSTFWRSTASWPPTLIPTRDTQPPSRTALAEDAFGIPRSLYFYAGRAFPRAGGIAFAFGPPSETHHTGTASPFDTGGLYFDADNKPRIFMALPDDLPTRTRLCASKTHPLTDWRHAFAAFLAAHFTVPSDYWNGRPTKADSDGILLDPRNTWQAWTFEVRFAQDHAIADVEFWCAKEDDLELFYRHATDVVPAEYQASLEAFAGKKLPVAPGGALNYCELVELEITNRLGL